MFNNINKSGRDSSNVLYVWQNPAKRAEVLKFLQTEFANSSFVRVANAAKNLSETPAAKDCQKKLRSAIRYFIESLVSAYAQGHTFTAEDCKKFAKFCEVVYGISTPQITARQISGSSDAEFLQELEKFCAHVRKNTGATVKEKETETAKK